MRVVAIAIITALLSAGCAIQAGDPPAEETQRPTELVGVYGGEQQGAVNARPEVQTHTSLGQTGPAEDSPNPSPWTGGSGAPHGGTNNGGPAGQIGGGNNGEPDNPNPSPWSNPNGPHWGGIPAGAGGGTAGNGG
jgi:hypothetical protein